MAYKIDGNGNHVELSKYTRIGVPTLSKIFPNDNEVVKKLLKRSKNARDGWLRSFYHTRSNSSLVRRILYVFILKVLHRVANGDMFVLPGRSQASITLKRTPKEIVKKLRQAGQYQNINIVRSGFEIPRFAFDLGPRSPKRDFRIYVGTELNNIAIKNAENMALPWTFIPKQKADDL